MATNNLVIDMGNTQTKCALFNEGNIVLLAKFSSLSEWTKWLKKISYKSVIVSSVATKQATAFVLEKLNDPIHFNHLTPLPIQNAYKTPETLGLDRLANAVAAHNLDHKKPVLVIDGGTCLKFDITNNGCYLGGAISVGLNMRFKALHHFTAQLPMIDNLDSLDIIGNNTETSMRSGALNGFLFEIKSTIEAYEQHFKNLSVVCTGGNSQLIVNSFSKQKNSIFADRWLTLKGLNQILAFNEK